MKVREDLIVKVVKNKSVLDLGNAWGDFGDYIKGYAKSYKSLDIEKGADYQKDLNKPFDLKKKFDVIVGGELIEHLENPGIFLETVHKHLKKGGVFFLSTPNPTSFRFFIYLWMDKEPAFGGHVTYFTKDALILLLKRYFRSVKVGFTNNTTNIQNKEKISWKIKFKFENLVGDVIPRLSPHLYAICRK